MAQTQNTVTSHNSFNLRLQHIMNRKLRIIIPELFIHLDTLYGNAAVCNRDQLIKHFPIGAIGVCADRTGSDSKHGFSIYVDAGYKNTGYKNISVIRTIVCDPFLSFPIEKVSVIITYRI